MTRPKLLFLAEQVPIPCGFGPRHQSFRVLDTLTRFYDVTLLVINQEMELGDLEATFSILQHRMPGLSTISVWRSAPAFKGDVGTGRVHQVANRFELMLLDQPSLAEYLPPTYRGLVIYHCHQDEKEDRLEKSQRSAEWLARLRMLPQFDPVTLLLQRADIVLCEGQSENTALMPLTRSTPTLIPFAFDETLLQYKERVPHRADKLRLLFVADTTHEVVIKPLERFLSFQWSAIRRRFPSLEFEIALPSTDCLDPALISPDRNIRVKPFHGSWLGWLGQTCLFINPVVHPASMSQTMNAMAMGFPVLAPSPVRDQLPAELPILTMDTVDEAISQVARTGVDRLLWQRCAASRSRLEEACSFRRLADLIATSIVTAYHARRSQPVPVSSARD